MKTRPSCSAALLFTPEYVTFEYGQRRGQRHPMNTSTYQLTLDLIRACGLNPCIVQVQPATDEEILLFHTPDYLQMLTKVDDGQYRAGCSQYGLDMRDNPVFKGVAHWARLTTGATLQAVQLVLEGSYQAAFNMAGGFHHAMPAKAGGFCYLNDPAIAIAYLLQQGQRVAYVDLDAHHPDGVQHGFYQTDQVLLISLHESGRYLFPGTGFEDEIGSGPGRGYTVNLPFPPYVGDQIFCQAFDAIVPPLVQAFAPDILIAQVGADILYNDPLANLYLTTNGYAYMIQRLRTLARKWVVLGGGGYRLANLLRAWTLVWSIITDQPLPAQIPPQFRHAHHLTPEQLPPDLPLQDPPFEQIVKQYRPARRAKMLDRAYCRRREVLTCVHKLQQSIFPWHNLPVPDPIIS